MPKLIICVGRAVKAQRLGQLGLREMVEMAEKFEHQVQLDLNRL